MSHTENPEPYRRFTSLVSGAAFAASAFVSIPTMFATVGRGPLTLPLSIAMLIVGLAAGMRVNIRVKKVLWSTALFYLVVLPYAWSFPREEFAKVLAGGGTGALDWAFTLITAAWVCGLSAFICSMGLYRPESGSSAAWRLGLWGFAAVVSTALCYFITYLGLPLMVPCILSGVLAWFAIASVAESPAFAEPDMQNSRSLNNLVPILAGLALGLGVMAVARAFAMFQVSQPMSSTAPIVIVGLSLILGAVFARKSDEGRFVVIELVRRIMRKPAEVGTVAAGTFTGWSVVLAGVALLWAGAVFEQLGVLGYTLPRVLPEGGAGLMLLVLIKAFIVFGPVAVAGAFLLISLGSQRKSPIPTLLAVAAGCALFPLAASAGLLNIVYAACGACLVAGVVLIVARKSVTTLPMLVRLVGAALFLSLMLWTIRPDTTLTERTLLFLRSGMDIRYTTETASATLTVAQVSKDDPDISRTDLYEDSLYLGGANAEDRYLRLAGLAPALFGMDKPRALVLNYSGGGTIASLLASGASEVVVVDPVAAKFDLQSYFESRNGLPLNDPRVKTVVADPVRYIAQNPKAGWDIVIFEPRPLYLGYGWLQADRATLKAVSNSLGANGIFVMPVTGLSKSLADQVLRTFRRAVRRDLLFACRGGFFTVGCNGDELKLDLDALQSFVDSNPKFASSLNLSSAHALFANLMSGGGFLREGGSGGFDFGPSVISWRRPCKILQDEWAAKSGSQKLADVFSSYNLQREVTAETVGDFVKGKLDKDAAARFMASGDEVLKGLVEFLRSTDEKAPQRAAEHFQTAFTINQGDSEARWLFNYLQKLDLVKVDAPDKDDELSRLLLTVRTSTENRDRVIALIKLSKYADQIDTAMLLELINDTDPEIRRLLAGLLGRKNDTLAREAVLRLIADPSPLVAKGAMNAAVTQSNAEAIDLMIAALDNPELTNAAMSSLTKFQSSRAAAPLAARLAAANEGGTLLILRALRQCGSPEQYDALMKVLEKGTGSLREQALFTLREIAVRYSDKSVVNSFVFHLTDPVLFVRLQAVLGLRELGGREEMPYLTEMFNFKPQNEDDTMLGRFIVEAAATCGGADALPFLAKVRESAEFNLRLVAVEAYGRTGTPEAVEILAQLARGDGFSERVAALDGIFHLPNEQSLPLLLEFAADSEPGVLDNAIRLLCAKRSPQTSDALVQLIEQGSAAQRLAVASYAWQARVPRLREPLLKLLNEPDEGLVRRACESLVRMSDDDLLVRFCSVALGHSSEQVRTAAAGALRFIPEGVSRDFAVISLAENLSESLSRTELESMTGTLAAIGGVNRSLTIKRNSTDEEIRRVVQWWKDKYTAKPGRQE